jgi:hypothetical protein
MGSGGETGLPACADLAGYNTCVNTECGLDACFANECADLVACYQSAADPCMADCTQSAECTSCITSNTTCLTSCVTTYLLCSEDGGACDALDACCAGLPSDMAPTCMQAASAARTVDDLGCSGVMMAYCPAGS